MGACSFLAFWDITLPLAVRKEEREKVTSQLVEPMRIA